MTLQPSCRLQYGGQTPSVTKNLKLFFHCVLQGLWKRFNSGKKAKTVVKDLFFGVERGEVFGLLGPNGAGKTTSLNMVTGDLPPTRGKVVYRYDYDIISNKT